MKKIYVIALAIPLYSTAMQQSQQAQPSSEQSKLELALLPYVNMNEINSILTDLQDRKQEMEQQQISPEEPTISVGLYASLIQKINSSLAVLQELKQKVEQQQASPEEPTIPVGLYASLKQERDARWATFLQLREETFLQKMKQACSKQEIISTRDLRVQTKLEILSKLENNIKKHIEFLGLMLLHTKNGFDQVTELNKTALECASKAKAHFLSQLNEGSAQDPLPSPHSQYPGYEIYEQVINELGFDRVIEEEKKIVEETKNELNNTEYPDGVFEGTINALDGTPWFKQITHKFDNAPELAIKTKLEERKKEGGCIIL